MTLKEKTLDLLTNRPRPLTLAQISREADIKESWLRMFSRDKIEHPSVNTVEKLYNYLSIKKLKV